jgi:nickel-dependent lactate racemase
MSSHTAQTTVTIRFGANAKVDVDLPAGALLAHCDAPRGARLMDVTEGVKAALAQPLDFPPLAQAAVPGDRVVLALDADVPQAPAIVAEVFSVLSARGVDAADVTILRTQADERAGLPDPHELIPAADRSRMMVKVHDPRARDRLGYLAAGGDHEPVYLNRLLCEADLVVPIGCLRCEGALGYYGMHGGLFPAFSDAASIERVVVASGDARRPSRDEGRVRKRIEEVGWLLGVQFTLQVIPGDADDALEVLAGKPEAVFERGQQLAQAAWRFQTPRRADLVISTICGGPAQQSWDHVARAVATASKVARDDGAIVVCTDLAAPPGEALARLASARDPDVALRKIRKEHLFDAEAALQIAAAQRNARIYLLSRLDDAAVEELGIAAVGDARRIARLVEQHDSCVVLGNAHNAVVTVVDE